MSLLLSYQNISTVKDVLNMNKVKVIVESFNVIVLESLHGRGLLPDPNPRVPKYFRVSGRVSG